MDKPKKIHNGSFFISGGEEGLNLHEFGDQTRAKRGRVYPSPTPSLKRVYITQNQSRGCQVKSVKKTLFDFRVSHPLTTPSIFWYPWQNTVHAPVGDK